MRRLHALWALALAVLATPAAEARRTVVDFDPDGNASYKSVGGYCDYDNYECTPTPLPYTVDFGTEDFQPTSAVLNYGDGALLFGDYGQYAQPGPEYYFAPLVTGGIDSTAYNDAIGNFSYEQYTTLTVFGDGSIQMIAASCYSTTNCGGYRYILNLTPEPTGFAASVTYFDDESYAYGHSVPYASNDFTQVSNIAGQTRYFYVPATITGLPTTQPPEPPAAVPEPATWAMMLAGFAAVGAALRRRDRAGGGHPPARLADVPRRS